jgi:outer membrane receptor protein involved in Fe transport
MTLFNALRIRVNFAPLSGGTKIAKPAARTLAARLSFTRLFSCRGHRIHLKLCAILLFLGVVSGIAEPLAHGALSGTVVDIQGKPITGAKVTDAVGHILAISDANGSFALSAGITRIQVAAAHYVPISLPVPSGTPFQIILDQPLESVVVTAYRTPLDSSDSPASTRVLDNRQLRQAAAPALDDKLRQIPGFELYRRSSSLVANPTTEGVSLRGLGSTAASRSLVVFDDVPLNDPYGSWIHWEEIPELAVHSIEVVRGGASDLYGSSAIGGVISIISVRPQAMGLQLSLGGGSQSLIDDSMRATAKAGAWSGIVAGGAIATDGYTLIAPSLRGPVDQPSNLHAQNALIEADREWGSGGRVFLRGNALNEIRHNGTLLQYNGTRLGRGASGMDWNHLSLRVFGGNEHFRQTFSSIAANRESEKLTRFGFDPADEIGAQARWRQSLGNHSLLVVGADTRDIRAADLETLFTGAGSVLNTSAHQRQTGVYGEALVTPRNWTLSAGGRIDHFSNFDPRQYPAPSTPLPTLSETVFDPRLGLVRRLTSSLVLNASGFRAYRAPTENELYRTGQVGQQVTLPNPDLRSERATGWETGFQTDLRRYGSSLRASYFWTQVNRPITALTISTNLSKRENLGQIESRGISLDYAAQPASWIFLIGGWQYANATVTKFKPPPQPASPEPSLVGLWIPEVPHNMATAQVRLTQRRIGLLSVQGRMSGRQFDNDLNTLLLSGYFRLDAFAEHDFNQHVTIFASGENLFDRSIQVGRTPLLTLGTPRSVRFGVRIAFGE